ncbi:zinc finger BED domain-containing protein 1-like [Xyrichtys novacula]|uniref:Zinc finger BED domain-containing protein 1-like n=1 Tax=Xyrichtys novacula TaxID=13765 RepID=A0AAV1H7E5_XYRNO|nr:zinc finger BED domain-containing protein 1-like [Xyrichtys novacula]
MTIPNILPHKKISTVWHYFDAADDNKVVCRLCKQKLTYNHSTGVMRNHIHSRHLDVNLHGEDGEAGPSGHGGGARQTSMRAFVPDRRCDAHRTARITQLVCEMTARDILPPASHKLSSPNVVALPPATYACGGWGGGAILSLAAQPVYKEAEAEA